MKSHGSEHRRKGAESQGPATALRRRTEQGQGGDKQSLGKARVRLVSALNGNDSKGIGIE